MEALSRMFAHASGQIFLFLLVAIGIQTILLIRLSRRLDTHNRRWSAIARDASGMDLETVLAEHARERAALLARHEEAQGRLARLEDGLVARKGRLGVVRYDAFPDVGGEHSFSLALLDDAGDGAVISSIIGREEARVYCKGMIQGRSDRTLTHEEKRAIESAQSGQSPA